MNKQDWLHVVIKGVGLYLAAAHLPTLLASTFTLIMVLTQKSSPALSASTVYLWQGPIVSGLTVSAGLILLFCTSGLAALIQSNDKKSSPRASS